MKKTLFLIITLLSLFIWSFMACDDEKEPVETMYSGFMTGYTDAEGYISVLNDDFGKQYMVSEKSEQLKSDTLYRLVASVALDEHLTARIIQMAPTISYVAPEDSIMSDTMRVKDPLEIQSLYIGGGYLNIYVGIKVQKEDTKHSILYTHSKNKGQAAFKIYHNAYGDGQVYTKHAYISIPLHGYGLAKNDTVFLNCKGYQEDYEYELIYK